ncbi:TonB-dependent receptor [Luteimonas aquatica]|uniref:TonB-dependent receptor n=1 Tax=Luteimonas aquatica TaxID=450364 RepID=UPI001F59404A|nr:TonB-dependent receptor [Luteimonas aquatica]
MMTIRKTMLSAGILAALLAARAQAQEQVQEPPQQAQAPAAPQAVQDPTELDTVVVQGIRASLQSSLQTKRNADAIVEAITAEDIGKFPDKNVAESLSHIPGVTVDRNFGQGEQVSIRGTEPSLNRTLLNGQTIASADWQILDGPGRTFNYTLLSPEIVGRLEVFKSPEARIDEGSIGGTVIVYTRRPLDLPANTINASLGHAYNDRSDDSSPSVSGLYSWKNPAESFGFLFSALYSKEELRRDGVEVFSFPTVASTTAGGGFPTVTGDDRNAVFPNAINSAIFQQERTLRSFTFGLQAKPSDTFELNLTGVYIKGQYNNYNQSRYAFTNCGTPGACASSVTAATIRNGLVTDARVNNGLTLLDAIDREAQVKTYSVDLRADWRGEGWNASAQAGTTKADGGTQKQNFLEFAGVGGYDYHIGEKSASVDFDNDPADPASMGGIALGELRAQPTRDKEHYLQGDYSLNVDWGPVSQLLVGAKYRKHETGQTDRIAAVDPARLSGLSLADFYGGTTPGDFMDGIDAGGGLTDWAMADRLGLRKFLRGLPEAGALAERPEGSFDIEEKIGSAYAQLNFGFGDLRGNLGVRYVRTQQTSVGQTRTPQGLFPNKFDKTYKDWLPTLNVAWDAREDLVLRLAAARSLARANFDDLSSFIVLRDTVNTGTGGNPDLEPYRANNYDLSAEWYFSETGILAATAFYKDIDTFIINQSAKELQFNVTDGQFETYDITRPRNGRGGRLYGLELAFQKSWDSGFGIMSNYTYSEGGTSGGLEVPFNSKNTFNITPFYENDRFSARLTYSWRDKYFRAIGVDGAVTTNDDYAQVDTNLTYRVNEYLELSLQGLNLLDETQYRYAGKEDRPLGLYRNGRRYFINARVKF